MILMIRKYDHHYSKHKKFFFVLLWILLILLVGLQNKMGGDNLSYEDDFYEMAPLGNIDFEENTITGRLQPLWIIFIGLTKTINDSYTCFHLIHSICVNVCFALVFYKFTKYSFFATLLFFISFDFFVFNIDLQRESLAVASFCLSVLTILKKKRCLWILSMS